MNCICCGKELGKDDIGFHKKLVNRGAKENFRCIECNCKYFDMTLETGVNMIKRFKEQGCTLFV